ncbi:hypothetical protein NUSPORA_01502 [Nucleospora cyclopteri]
MLKVEDTSCFGKIHRIHSKEQIMHLKDCKIIQTVGKRIEGAVSCRNERELLGILKKSNRNIIIYSMNSFRKSDLLMFEFYRMNTRGFTIYIL